MENVLLDGYIYHMSKNTRYNGNDSLASFLGNYRSLPPITPAHLGGISRSSSMMPVRTHDQPPPPPLLPLPVSSHTSWPSSPANSWHADEQHQRCRRGVNQKKACGTALQSKSRVVDKRKTALSEKLRDTVQDQEKGEEEEEYKLMVVSPPPSCVPIPSFVSAIRSGKGITSRSPEVADDGESGYTSAARTAAASPSLLGH